jgi:Uma2 family endonuclease
MSATATSPNEAVGGTAVFPSKVSASLVTAEQFAEWVARPENADRHFELERGEVIEMPPPKPMHGYIANRIARLLDNYAEKTGVGFVLSNDSGVVVERNPDSVRGPDVCYFSASFGNASEMEDFLRQYATIPPVIAVEVLSPEDRVNNVALKVDEYLAFGVKQVWVVDPESKDIAVHRPGKPTRLLRDDAELTGGDELPGFSCCISDFFRLPGRKPNGQKAT